jgi:nitrate reductase NapE component
MSNDVELPSSKRFKRKIILVNPSFQIKAIIVFAIFPVVFLTGFYEFADNIIINVSQDLRTPVLVEKLTQAADQLEWIFFIFLACTLFLNILFGLILTHKMAGPVYRLREHFKLMNDTGKDIPLTFREGDFFTDVLDPINTYIDKKSTK